ncbi:type VI secretion system amidase effector protein Tae4 [Roseibium sediminicola]|uniref:Type VI secretion system amidase effector protein Tae4 n=1 Tax=Roseibium sediminicola TaxID=2933272 RepID=A0ABT0GZI4_9HYPH|nr:type VI secretion system amidase effector protein Tae4 [Roseibium sp. CAU 1639]MCK7614837.1 type VI secretion system amidase effector protein Tae4 [Roseibium sp. CAU 1639]
MTLRIEVVSIAYTGGDIGDDIRASFKVNGSVAQKDFKLAKGKTWTPPIRWILLNDTKSPTAAGATQNVLITITERDAFINDVGSSTFTFTVPKHSFREKTFTHTVTVTEDSTTATFTVTFKIRCIHLLFETLWANHPTTRGNNDPCQTGGKSNYDNQCAIRMGLTLERSSVSLSGFNGAHCWHGHGREHVLRVEELIAWLQSQTTRLGTPVTHTSVTSADFANKLGIAAFINFWGTGNQGDHIDLWNGKIVRKGDPNYFQRSERVVFWQL